MKSTASLFTAALESASVFNHAVRECAGTSGLLELLAQTRSVDEIIARMGFDASRRETLDRLLLTLVAEKAVERQVDQAGRVGYRARSGGLARGERYAPRAFATADWYGESHLELIRSSNKAFLGAGLELFKSPEKAIRFNKEFETAWRTNLLNPLYEFGRLRCIRELTQRGTRFLDLACGPGFGAQRLAEFSSAPCTILGVDKSEDFLDIARQGVYPSATVEFVQRDLNQGLPPLAAGSFDGVLFNGAFHFMADKPARLAEIARVLRPGGVLALGHCFSHSGFGDEAMHDFYFSLLDEPLWVVTWSGLKDLVGEAGFGLVEEFHRGSHSYLLAERLPDAAHGGPAP